MGRFLFYSFKNDTVFLTKRLNRDIIYKQNELCKMYGISRITYRQALKLLESKNLIHTFHRKGLCCYTKIDSFEADIKNSKIAGFLFIQFFNSKLFILKKIFFCDFCIKYLQKIKNFLIICLTLL